LGADIRVVWKSLSWRLKHDFTSREQSENSRDTVLSSDRANSVEGRMTMLWGTWPTGISAISDVADIVGTSMHRVCV